MNNKYYTPTKPEPPTCIYNDAVNCNPKERRCDKCGWNPVVSGNRLANFCKKHRIAFPEYEPKAEEE